MKQKANKIFNNTVQEMIKNGDSNGLYSLFINSGLDQHKDELSIKLQNQVDQILEEEGKKKKEDEIRADDERNQEKVNEIFQVIDNKNYNLLFLYENDAKQNDMVSSVLSYA